MSRRTRGEWFSAAFLSGGRSKKRADGVRRDARRLRVETLEERRVLAAVVVGVGNNIVNGDTSSIDALIASPGADGISLHEAILAANATPEANSISFAPAVAGATINVGGGLPTITGNLALQGPITLYGNDSVRGLTIAAGANVSVTGVNIMRGYAEFGGAIHNSGTLTFTDGSLTENVVASYGGAIYNAPGATMTVTGTTMRYNEATGNGGAIYNAGTLTVSRSRRGFGEALGLQVNAAISGNVDDVKGIIENKASENGGAIYNASGGELTVTDVSILWNHAEFVAGGIYNAGTATVNGIIGKTTYAVSDHPTPYYLSAISYNTGFYGGSGGVHNAGTLTLNSASVLTNGGGIGTTTGGVVNTGTLTVVNSTLADNFGGAGINNSGAATVITSAIYGNQGKGLLNSGTLVVNNTIVAANTTGDVASSASISGSHNFVGDGSGAGLAGTLSGDPKLRPLIPFANHGPVPVMIPLSDSPLINAGDSNLVPSGATTDQRGVTRIKNGAVDIGPVEFGSDTLVVTTLVDERDRTMNPAEGAGTSLREAIRQVSDLQPFDGGTITFAPGLTGTISLVHGPLQQVRDVVGLTIVGPGDDLLTIDAAAVQSGEGGILYNYNSLIAISGVTFANGTSSQSGGAIFNWGRLALTDCSFINNSAGDDGGAIYSINEVQATNCVFAGNSTLASGGAIYNEVEMSVTSSTFTGNSALNGGAIRNDARNYDEYVPDTPTVTDCTFSENSASDSGGAIYNFGGQYAAKLIVTGSTFFQNSAEKRGGGIYSASAIVVDRSTLYGNSAANNGGEFPAVGGGIEINAYNIFGDSFFPSSALVTNTIVAGSTSGLDVYRLPHRTAHLSGGSNLIADGRGGLPNTISGDPLLGPLQDNGGPTWTMAPLPGSPVIDAGSATYPQPFPELTGVTFEALPGQGTLLSETTYTYRVVTYGLFGEWATSAEYSFTTGSDGPYALRLSWDTVAGQTAVHVYGRTQGAEQYLGKSPINVSSPDSSTTFVDKGINVPNGAIPAPYVYPLGVPLYDQRGESFERVLGGRIDLGAVEVPSGDFDADGYVDGADFLLWQRQFGAAATPSGSGADGDGSGSVDGADLNVWTSQFGQSSAAAAPLALPAIAMQATVDETSEDVDAPAERVLIQPVVEAASEEMKVDAAFVALAQAEHGFRARPTAKGSDWRALRAAVFAPRDSFGFPKRGLRSAETVEHDSCSEVDVVFSALGDGDDETPSVDNFGGALVQAF